MQGQPALLVPLCWALSLRLVPIKQVHHHNRKVLRLRDGENGARLRHLPSEAQFSRERLPEVFTITVGTLPRVGHGPQTT